MASSSANANTLAHADTRTARLAALLVLALTLAVYQRVWHFGFVDWDDGLHVYGNPYLNPVTSAHLLHFWRMPYKGLYIPLSYMAYAALSVMAHSPVPLVGPDGAIVQVNPHVFHAASIILHLLNVLLVFTLLRRFVRAPWAAAAGALLFAVHPLQVESVAWISELRGLLAAFFVLAALTLYLRYAAGEGKRGTYCLAFLAYVLALLAKPDAAVAPLLALSLDCLLVRRPWPVALKTLLPWFLAVLPIALCTHGAQPFQIHPVPLWKRPFVAGDALAFYLVKLAVPVRLAAIYDRRPEIILHHAWGYLTWLLPAAVAVCLWRVRRRCPALGVAAILFVVALLPILGLIPFQYQNLSTVADRYAYLALLGPAFALAWAVTRARPTQALTLCACVLPLCAALSIVQAGVWRDTETLFTHSVAIAPDCPAALNNLSKSEFSLGHTAAAIRDLQIALVYNPRYGEARYNLANLLKDNGDRAGALAEYQTLLRINPGVPEAYTDMGEIYGEEGQVKQAETYLRQALKLDNNQAEAHEDLAQALAAQGNVAASIPEWRQAVHICPDDAIAHHALAVALAQTGQMAAAHAELREVARVNAKLASLQTGTP